MSVLKISKVEKEGLTIHSVTSPDEGEMVNSQIIETANKVVIIDTPLLKEYGVEFRSYVDSLGKTIDRVLTTHSHPDHWFCLSYFEDIPKYAFQETIEQIAGVKDLVVGFHTQVHGDMMPEKIILPDLPIEEGELVIDGVKLLLKKFLYVEDNCLMVVEIPDHDILMAQDLIYKETHMYIATKNPDSSYAVDNWVKVLEEYKAKAMATIVPGHGEITDSSVFQGCIDYLKFSLEAITSAANGDDYIKKVKEKYPDYRIPLMLDMTKVMSFPADQ